MARGRVVARLIVDTGYGLVWDAAFLTGGPLFFGVLRVAAHANAAHTQGEATSSGATS